MTTAIEALANYYNSLNTQDKEAFRKETGFDGVPVGIMSAEFAEEYCKSHNIKYSDNNIWGLYNKGKAQYEKATVAYNKCEKAYNISKANLSKAEKERDKLLTAFYFENGKDAVISPNQKDIINRETKYTTYSKEVKANDSLLNSLLDARRNAVSLQQKGLSMGSIMMAQAQRLT